nr:hypothetical protein BaRGS_020085 [Batillaria attramentaria]
MRTKVEKRRVRHDPPGDVLNSAGQGDGVNSVSPVVLSSSSVLTGGPLVAAAAVQEGQKKEESVSPPIKKPPKKRRNNEKKADVVTDLTGSDKPSGKQKPRKQRKKPRQKQTEQRQPHPQSTSADNSPKPAKKKKKSKPKVKKGANDSTKAGDADAGVEKEGMQTEKPAKPKPKKAKKRKADAPAVSEGGENKEAGDERKAEDGDHSKPSPKKKKKKEENSGEATQTKKKKSPSKSKKTKQTQPGGTDGAETANTDSNVQQNGLPHSNDGSIDANTTESKPSEAEIGTSTEGLSENDGSSSLEKKVKKTLEEVSCQECGHKTRGQAALSRHMKKMHEKSISLPYPCNQENCEYSASKVSLLARHMLTHRLYMCSRCQFTVDTKDQYEDHLQVVHNVKLDCKLCKRCNRYIKCDTMPLDKHLETCQGPVPFSCDVCKKEFRYESSLKVHHHSHFPDQPKLFHCSQCDYSSNYRANLHKHVQNMHVQRPKDIKCLTCDKMFSTEDNMRRHMKIHTQVRPHKCDKCDKAFKSACALKGHAVCHELARPYQCNIDNCNREFRTPKFLKSHQEEFHRLIPKKYHCPVEGCSFSFFKLSHLKRHEISHTGERNFHCKWPGCGKSFRHSDNLKVHLRQHTDERPISCHHCSFTCRQKSSLHWHIKKMHGQSNLSSSPDNSNMDAVSLSSLTNPEPMETTPSISEGAEVVVEGVSGVSVNIVLGEDGEVPVTITEIHPVDLYEFHSDNDSSDEATPGVFKRNKSKMASAAPLPPPPKELLMKNSVLDVLDAENNQVEVTDGKVKPKKKKSPTKKTKTAKQNAEEDAEKKENEAATAGEGEETKTTPEKKPQTETKKKSSASKPKKKKAESKESAAENEEAKDSEPAKETKTPPKTKKAPAKKKTPTKQSPKEASAVAEKPVKTKAPAKGKKSPKTRSSPKKPSSPKGKLAKPATRKTPPRKAAAKKAPAKAPAKKSPAKKTATKKKAPAKKKAPPKKKAAAKKSKEKQEEPEAVVEDKVEESVPERGRSRKKSQTRASKDRRAGVEELASSPARPDSPVESEEENMPQGKGSPYREFDSQHMESSPEPRESPSPPASPTPGDLLQKSPASEDEAPVKESEEVAVPAPVEAPEETEQPDAESSSDGEVINDIPLTPPRAPAPPPPESSDEEEMVPSPPAHMPMSADTSDTAAPSSVLTDVQQPGSQAPDFQQPHSREEFQQPHSREEFQQPLSQQPMSREEYPQIHSREEILQPHSREEYTQPLSREEYTQPHSISQPHSQQEYIQPHSREDYPQLHSREELHQQHSREELQPQGSVPEPVSEPVPSVHSEGMHDDASMPHSVVQYDPATASPVPVSEAESAYQYLQGLAQSADSMPEPLAGEPTRLQQLEALAEKPMEDSRPSDMTVKSPVAAPTSVITSLSPVATNALVMGPADMSSHRRMEILASDRQVEQTIARDTSSVLPRLPDPTYDTYSALNPLAAGATRDNNNLFPAPPGTPSFMRLTESEAMLQRQRMTTPFLPTPQPPDRSLSRLPESSLRAPNPSALLRRPATMAGADMFPATPGMPQAMQRNPFTNTWAGQDVRPAHWGQAPTYLQRPANAPTTPFPFATKDNYLAGREFMFDPTVRPGVTDRNMFASLSTSQASASETNPFPLDRFDLSTYFGSHAYSGASGLDYSRTACGTTPKTFDERYRQTAASMTDFRPLPPTTSTDMFSGIGVGVNSLNSASFNLDKYAMYGRDPMYHAAAQQLSDNTNSAFLTHPAPTQHSVFDRDYAARSLYSQNPAYPFIDERQYSTAAKLTGHTPAATMGQERDFMTRSTANENQMQDPYRCGMLYNVMNRYGFE